MRFAATRWPTPLRPSCTTNRSRSPSSTRAFRRQCRWIIEQCLAKDAAERYAATEDLARELRRVRERLREAHGEPGPVERGESRRWAMPAAVLVAAAVTAAGVLAIPRPTATLRFTPIASAAGYEGTPVWSPDGQSLAWVGDVDGVLQIFTRRLADAVATQITRGLFDAEQPFWAPDSRGLYFISPAGDGNGLWRVGTAGGRAELLLENVNHAAIDPSGRQLALLRNETTMRQRLWWASANGHDLMYETKGRFGEERGFGLGGQLQFRPDGKALLAWVFNDRQADGETSSTYFLVSTSPEGEVREVLSSVASTASLPPFSWLPDNRHVVVGIADGGGGPRHLWIADTESAAISQLTSTHTNETWPSASPDGHAHRLRFRRSRLRSCRASPRTDSRYPALWRRRGTRWIRPGHRTANSSRSSPTGPAAWASGCAAETGSGSGRW